MKKLNAFYVVLLMVTALGVHPLFSSTLEETFKKQIEFSSGGLIGVENTNGSIEIKGWDKNMVLIKAEKKVKASNRKEAEKLMEKLEIEISENPKELIIDTHLPQHNGGGLFDWIFGDHASASVKYKIFVPIDSDADIHTTNGSIDLNEIAGRIRVRTTNGKIHAENINGKVDARTTNGSISMDFEEMYSDGDMNFYTTNGSIKVYLPENVRCSVKAKTTNGSINSDFPLKVKGKYNSKRVNGEINGGGPLLDFHTTNGSVRIYRK